MKKQKLIISFVIAFLFLAVYADSHCAAQEEWQEQAVDLIDEQNQSVEEALEYGSALNQTASEPARSVRLQEKTGSEQAPASQEKFATSVIFGDDGVDKKEALEIAKEYLQFSNIKDQYYTIEFGIGAGFLVKEIDGVWHAVFLKKGGNFEGGGSQSLRITIDAETGAVLGAEVQEGFYVESRQQ